MKATFHAQVLSTAIEAGSILGVTLAIQSLTGYVSPWILVLVAVASFGGYIGRALKYPTAPDPDDFDLPSDGASA